MKKICCNLAALILLPSFLVAGGDDINVISYYAVTNSLDGQPVINQTNVLRFFPVFAMRDQIDSAHVTIYFGSKRFSRGAISVEDKKFWEVMLPTFELGEAIQRIEVEVHFKLENSYHLRYLAMQQGQRNHEHELERASIGANISTERPKVVNNLQKKNFDRDPKQLVRIMATLDSGNASAYISARNSYLGSDSSLTLEDYRQFDQLIQEYRVLANPTVRDTRLKEIIAHQSEDARLRDSLNAELARRVEVGLGDTMYTGQSVRKSDIVFDPTYEGARILYRNYKSDLRKMHVLDPAERLGIFRVRYIPFMVVYNPLKKRNVLEGQLSEDAATVFEVGITFGDQIVPGDEFVVSDFSYRHFGLAFTITDKLAKQPDVEAIVLTFDFSTYASIGIGLDFAQQKEKPYYSFGINKRAFEALISGIANIFK